MVRVEPLAAPTSFAAFCEREQLDVECRERPKRYRLPRWYAAAKGVDVRDGPFLVSLHGNGATPDEAVADYARQLAGQRIVIGASSRDRREVQAPNEWLPEAEEEGEA
jgi:hypothetical protein